MKITNISHFLPLFSKAIVNHWGQDRDDLSNHKYVYQELVIRLKNGSATCLFENREDVYYALYLGTPPSIEDENQRLILSRLLGLLIEHVHIDELLAWIEQGKALPEFVDLGIDEEAVEEGDDELIYEAKKVLGL